MTDPNRDGPLMRAVTLVYACALYAYPREFRQRWSRELCQVFETVCRQTEAARGSPGLLGCFMQAVGDIPRSAVAEWAEAAPKSIDWRSGVSVALATVFACTAGAIHALTDDDLLALLVVGAGSFICGLIAPQHQWRRSVMIGLGVPLALIVHEQLRDAALYVGPLSTLMVLPALGAGFAGAGTLKGSQSA